MICRQLLETSLPWRELKRMGDKYRPPGKRSAIHDGRRLIVEYQIKMIVLGVQALHIYNLLPVLCAYFTKRMEVVLLGSLPSRDTSTVPIPSQTIYPIFHLFLIALAPSPPRQIPDACDPLDSTAFLYSPCCSLSWYPPLVSTPSPPTPAS